MEDCLRERFRHCAVIAALLAALGGCEGITPVTADTTAPPTINALSPLKMPEWAGKRPTPYDGRYEGYLINEASYFLCPTADVYLRLAFDISNGLVRRAEDPAMASIVDGYVNDHGIFVANTSLKPSLGELFVGAIAADRMRGEWRAGSQLCFGRIELARIVGDRRYCEDRLSGMPYATETECLGIDRYLTAGEYETMLKAKKGKG